MDEVNLIDYYGSDRAVLARDISLDSTESPPSRIMLGALNHQKIYWYARVNDSEGSKLRKHEDAQLLWESEPLDFQLERAYEYDGGTFVFNDSTPIAHGVSVTVLDAATGLAVGDITRSDAINACLAASHWPNEYGGNPFLFFPIQLDQWDVLGPATEMTFFAALSRFSTGGDNREEFILTLHANGTVTAGRMYGIRFDDDGVASNEEHPYVQSAGMGYHVTQNPNRRFAYRLGDILAVDTTWRVGAPSLTNEGVDELRYFDTDGNHILSESAPHPTRSEFPGVMGTGFLPAPWPLGFDEDGDPYYLVGRNPNFEILNKNRDNVMPTWLNTIVNAPGSPERPIFITQGGPDLGGDTLIVVDGAGGKLYSSSGEFLYDIHPSHQNDTFAGLMVYSGSRLHNRPTAISPEHVITKPVVNNRILVLNLQRRAYYARMIVTSGVRMHTPQYRAAWSA